MVKVYGLDGMLKLKTRQVVEYPEIIDTKKCGKMGSDEVNILSQPQNCSQSWNDDKENISNNIVSPEVKLLKSVTEAVLSPDISKILDSEDKIDISKFK